MENNNKRHDKANKTGEPLSRRILWWTVYALIGGLMCVGLYLILIQYVYIGDTKPYETPPAYTPPPQETPVTATATPDLYTPTPSPEPTPEPEPIIPVQITLSKYKIQCDIEVVGRDGNEIGTVDSATIAAWFDESAAPNQSGNCIINGHVSFGGKKGAFSYLREMEEGDEIIIKLEDDSYRYYEVYSIEEYPYEEVPPFHLGKSGRDRLTLITCKGDYSRQEGTSLTRVIVICMPRDND